MEKPVSPPSMANLAPVMLADSSLARNSTRFAMSCGSRMRPMGVKYPGFLRMSSSSRSSMLVAQLAGWMELERTFLLRYSAAATWLSMAMAALLAP